jgi:hypothetical protein
MSHILDVLEETILAEQGHPPKVNATYPITPTYKDRIKAIAGAVASGASKTYGGARTAKNVAGTVLSNPITGGAAVLAAGAIDPGLGLMVRAAQKIFRGEMAEDTSQVSSSALYGYHPGFWSASSGPNSFATVPITQPVNVDGDPRTKPKKKKYYPDPKSRPREQDVANPAASASMIIGVDYGS